MSMDSGGCKLGETPQCLGVCWTQAQSIGPRARRASGGEAGRTWPDATAVADAASACETSEDHEDRTTRRRASADLDRRTRLYGRQRTWMRLQRDRVCVRQMRT